MRTGIEFISEISAATIFTSFNFHIFRFSSFRFSGKGEADEYRIGHFRNVRGLGKSMVVFRLFEKLKYSNERSTIF